MNISKLEKKYLKYKTKYLELKDDLSGGYVDLQQ